MSWFLAFAGFAVLIMLHELGHFMAAKATGMKVERFSLFFPPHVFKWRPKGSETDYTIGVIPLGGYCKIMGMTANEEVPEEEAYRAYHKQKPWKRVVVVAAGPAMNLLVAFLILWAIFLANGYVTHTATSRVAADRLQEPAKSVLRPGDTIVSVDGVRGGPDVIAKQIATHKCAGSPTKGCQAATAAKLTIRRDGKLRTLSIVPRYDATPGIEKMRIGFSYADHKDVTPLGVAGAAGHSVSTMWDVTTATLTKFAKLFDPQERKQLSGVVGGYEATREAFTFDTTQALFILALISLSLAIVNLFPFLPLDGGHIFWAVAEKVRGRPIAFAVMERASVVGFVLVVFIALIGFSNDIGRITSGQGFGVR
jgi:regulator of sigma E protease